jgi:hypothetical protein
MKNSLLDLNNHLFEQLERLNDDDCKGEKLTEELIRTKGISDIARNIIDNAKVVLDAHIAIRDGLNSSIPQLVGPAEKQ